MMTMLEHRYSIPNLVPWLCLGILGLRLCRFILEAEPPGCIPMQSIGTRVRNWGNSVCSLAPLG